MWVVRVSLMLNSGAPLAADIAAERGAITGRVCDWAGGALAGVAVEARGVGTGVARTASAGIGGTPVSWLSVDASTAYSRGRFRGPADAGDRIPGAIEGVVALGAAIDAGQFSGSLRLRWFGSRPLTGDDRVRSDSSATVNGAVSYRITSRWRLSASVFNLLGATASDIDYFYTSRLPGEPAGGLDDVHFHPIEPRSLRLALAAGF